MIKWAKKFQHKTYRFKDLPQESKDAVVLYMMGSRAEKKDAKANFGVPFQKLVKEFELDNGGARFSLYFIPMGDIAKRFEELHLQDFGVDSFDEFQKQYGDAEYVPEHKNKSWPIILDDDNPGEFMQDGWHRLHSYWKSGLKSVPAIEFVDSLVNTFDRL